MGTERSELGAYQKLLPCVAHKIRVTLLRCIRSVDARCLFPTLSAGRNNFLFFIKRWPLPARTSQNQRYELYTAIRGPFGTTTNLHPFPEIDIDERFPTQWALSSPAGLCTGNNSALLSFRAPRHDYWGGAGDLELLTVDASLLDGDVTMNEVRPTST